MTSPLVFAYGTRPEAIKLGPVVAELKALGTDAAVICTGQHTSLLAGSPAETDMATLHSLGLASAGNVLGWLARARVPLEAALSKYRPRVVVVQGDTMSAHAAALAAYDLHMPVAHVEAGVRSHDPSDPWPEEANRVEIAKLATWHFAATEQAAQNLRAEGITGEHIYVTGNPVVSALARYANVGPRDPGDHIVVTLHRREMQIETAVRDLCAGLMHAAARFPSVRFVWPLHPAVGKLVDVHAAFGGIKNVSIVPPLGYGPFVEMVTNALGVLTDSGGLVEEAATLGVPCVIVRRTNDRPEAVTAGVAVRCEPSANGLLMGAHWLTKRGLPRRPTAIYGTPVSASEIARKLVEFLGATDDRTGN